MNHYAHLKIREMNRELEKKRLDEELLKKSSDENSVLMNQYIKFMLIAQMRKSAMDTTFEEFKAAKSKENEAIAEKENCNRIESMMDRDIRDTHSKDFGDRISDVISQIGKLIPPKNNNDISNMPSEDEYQSEEVQNINGEEEISSNSISEAVEIEEDEILEPFESGEGTDEKGSRIHYLFRTENSEEKEKEKQKDEDSELYRILLKKAELGDDQDIKINNEEVNEYERLKKIIESNKERNEITKKYREDAKKIADDNLEILERNLKIEKDEPYDKTDNKNQEMSKDLSYAKENAIKLKEKEAEKKRRREEREKRKADRIAARQKKKEPATSIQ
ncbi:MAG: hypothetical protein K6B41_15420 [Butyrivibrio sp.]|nr:hypothetical protein [Butyrivibrio sp.]